MESATPPSKNNCPWISTGWERRGILDDAISALLIPIFSISFFCKDYTVSCTQ
jgi:hypothetical protein